MATLHEDDGLGRGKHILPTDWTVGVCCPLNALMVVGLCYGNARAAGLAVEEVPVQPVSNPADATFIAMIDGLVYIVAPQLADAAIVPSCALVAIDTGIGHLLRVAAEHAEHVLGEPPRQGVLFYFVMT